MSRAYKCDVCGGFYEKGVQDREARPPIFTNSSYKVDSIAIYNSLDPVNYKKNYDLCSGCAAKLMELIEKMGKAD